MHTDDKPCSILCLGQFQMYALDKHSNLLITIRVCAHFDWSRIIFFVCTSYQSVVYKDSPCSGYESVVGLNQIEERDLFFVLQIRDRKLDLPTGSWYILQVDMIHVHVEDCYNQCQHPADVNTGLQVAIAKFNSRMSQDLLPY